MSPQEQRAELARLERGFRQAGLPTLAVGQRAQEDVWTRAAPALTAVLLVEAVLLLGAAWAWWWQLAAFGLAAAVTLVGFVVLNRARGRRSFALPDDIGSAELGGFVALGGALGLLAGGAGDAVGVAGLNGLALPVAYLTVSYGLGSVLRFARGRLRKQLATSVELLARAIPLLLLVSVVLFVNTEMWQVFSSMNLATLAATTSLLATVQVAFVVVRIRPEIAGLERQVAAELPLSQRERRNVAVVMFVSQALQVLLVMATIAAFFVVLGALAIGAGTIESWTGSAPQTLLFLEPGGVEIRLTRELLQVAWGIAALCGLYYSVALLTDAVYRHEFLEELTNDLRQTFEDRARYLSLRRELREDAAA